MRYWCWLVDISPISNYESDFFLNIHYSLLMLKPALKISTNLQEINDLLVKYTSFINYFFEEISSSNIYVETVQDGFIVFWESKKHFEDAWLPYSDEIIKKGENLPIEENFLLRLGPPEEEFPNEGFLVSFESVSEETEEQLMLIENFYKNLNLNLGVDKIQTDGHNGVNVLFENFNQIKQYTSFLAVYLNLAYDVN